MKLLFFDDFKLGVVSAHHVVDVSQVVRDIPQHHQKGPEGLTPQLTGKYARSRA